MPEIQMKNNSWVGLPQFTTRDWAREIGEASQLDNLFLNESDINSLYVQSRNCFLAVNQFKHEKTPRGEDWDDRESGEGSSFLDNSD